MMLIVGDDGPSRVSIQLFGDCHISAGGRYLGSVPQSLLRIAAYILLEGRGQPVLRRRVSQLMWSESGAAQASADIRQTVARIRRFQTDNGFRFIAADAVVLWLVKDDNVSCDLLEFLDQLENPAPAAAVKLCELYHGDLLESLGSAGGGYEEWLSFQRPSLHNAFVESVSKAIVPTSSLTRQQRDFCARRLIRADPCHEGAYRVLMQGAADGGQIAVVRQLFTDCSRRLLSELGVAPEEETVRLYERLGGRSIGPGVRAARPEAS